MTTWENEYLVKPVIIIAIALVLLIPLSVFAQEESLSELTARLDAENLQKAKEAGSIVEPSSSNPQVQTQEMINCPSGYVAKAISGGGIICVNEITGQQLDNSTMINLDNTIGYVIIGVIIIIIIIAGIAKASSKSEPEQVIRKGWTEIEKEEVRIRQDGKCAKCHKPPPRWEYHHKDEDRSNNSLENCQGLCPNCHSIETHEW